MTFHAFTTTRGRHLVLLSDILKSEMSFDEYRGFLDRAGVVQELGTVELRASFDLSALSEVDGCDVMRLELEP